jgi:hypothetical protein
MATEYLCRIRTPISEQIRLCRPHTAKIEQMKHCFFNLAAMCIRLDSKPRKSRGLSARPDPRTYRSFVAVTSSWNSRFELGSPCGPLNAQLKRLW